MNANPLWSNPDLTSAVISMMDARRPVQAVIDDIFCRFGITLQKNQITGKYYRHRHDLGTVTNHRPSVYDAEIPGVSAMVADGLLAAEIAARIGKEVPFVRRYCAKRGLRIAADPSSSTARLNRSRSTLVKLKAEEPVHAAPHTGVRFTERGTGCVFPLWSGPVKFEEKTVCGCKVVSPGKSYCAEHAKLAYASGPTRQVAIAAMSAAAASVGRHPGGSNAIVGEDMK